jgi:hypothetical protein
MVNDPNPFFIIAGLLPVADRQRAAGQYLRFCPLRGVYISLDSRLRGNDVLKDYLDSNSPN